MRFTICGPNVRAWTKWLSMTSTCTASAVLIRWSSASILTKSAESTLGCRRISTPSAYRERTLDQLNKHGIGPVAVGPELDCCAATVPRNRTCHDPLQYGGCVQECQSLIITHNPVDHRRSLLDHWRARDVGQETSWCERVETVPKQRFLQLSQRWNALWCLNPARLWSTAQGAQSGAGRIKQNPRKSLGAWAT